MKEFLSRNGIAYVEKNIRADPEAKKQLIAMGFNTIPVTVVDDQAIAGLDEVRLRQALGISR